MQNEAPVLFIVFARPEYAKITFEAIRKTKPKKLYFYSNIARDEYPDEIQRNTEVRSLINEVDWECDLQKYFRSDYVTAGVSIASAITWAFKTTDRLIIIEEDCVPAQPFFSYCNTLLEKYKDDSRICMISGNNYTEKANITEDSYFFSKYGHIWGWATWKRAWDKYDFEITDWPLFIKNKQISNVFYNKIEQKYFLNFFNKYFMIKEKGTWDYQWFFCRIKDVGLSIVPQSNLVTNIGVKGVNTSEKSKAHFVPVNEAFSILKEPNFILCNTYYDTYHFKKHINPKYSLVLRILRKVGKILNNYLKSHE